MDSKKPCSRPSSTLPSASVLAVGVEFWCLWCRFERFTGFRAYRVCSLWGLGLRIWSLKFKASRVCLGPDRYGGLSRDHRIPSKDCIRLFSRSSHVS